jgi:hypothetical protein
MPGGDAVTDERGSTTNSYRRLGLQVTLAVIVMAAGLAVLGRALDRRGHACDAQLAAGAGAGTTPGAPAVSCAVRYGDGWYQWEQLGDAKFRWAGARGELLVQVSGPATLNVSGEILSAVRPNVIAVGSVDGSAAAENGRITVDSMEWQFHPFGEIAVSLTAGEHRLRFESVRGAAASGPGKRTIGFALKGLRVQTEAQACVVLQ